MKPSERDIEIAQDICAYFNTQPTKRIMTIISGYVHDLLAAERASLPESVLANLYDGRSLARFDADRAQFNRAIDDLIKWQAGEPSKPEDTREHFYGPDMPY